MVRSKMTETWKLFRYRAINSYFWESFEKSEFYCASPERLNDPFDCRLNWRASLLRAVCEPGLTEERLNKLEDMACAFHKHDP